MDQPVSRTAQGTEQAPTPLTAEAPGDPARSGRGRSTTRTHLRVQSLRL